MSNAPMTSEVGESLEIALNMAIPMAWEAIWVEKEGRIAFFKHGDEKGSARTPKEAGEWLLRIYG
jgi:hypothetical protein